MQRWLMPLDVISFSAAISACKKGQQWQLVAPLFDEMQTGPVLLNVISFNAAISVCEWQQAAPMLCDM
eukprot:10104252-Karenia_brevis.AAC.1